MNQSWKSSAAISIGVAIFFYVTQIRDENPTLLEAVSLTLFMFAIAFLTMRITARLVEGSVKRWGPKPKAPPPPPGPAVIAPTSERIEHNRRRRDRRRERR